MIATPLPPGAGPGGWRAQLAGLAAWFREGDPATDGTVPGSASASLRRLVRLVRAQPLVTDGVLAGGLLCLSLLNAASRGGRADSVAGWALQAALVVPLLWRRRYAVGVFVIVCSVAFLQWLYVTGFGADLAILIALYTVTTRAPRRVAIAAAGVVEAGVMLEAVRHIVNTGWEGAVILLSGMVAAAYFLGTSTRTRRVYLAALVERAGRLEYERDQQARIAAAAERAGIAREMHDVLAHSLAVIITLAEAAVAKRHSDPDRAAASMGQVSEVGRQALDETRRVLGVLRTEQPGGTLAPQPGVDQLDALLEQARGTGLAAQLTVTGRPFALPGGAELALYRIVQEALTNTLKHAPGAAHVRVRLRYAEPVVAVQVDDDGIGGAGTEGATAGGHGLTGMRERAALYGGAVTAGPGPVGGWRVSAWISTAAPAGVGS